MRKIFKSNNNKSFFWNHDKESQSSSLFVEFFFLLVVIVFFVEFIQNNPVFAEKEFKQCGELANPSNFDELSELRLCIKKIKFDKAAEKESLIIRYTYQGSLILTEKLNFSNGKKSKQIISEKNEN